MRYEFRESDIVIHIKNDTGEAVPARFLMSPQANAADAATSRPQAAGPVTVSRGKARLSMKGIDQVTSPSRAKLDLIANVPARGERTLELNASVRE